MKERIHRRISEARPLSGEHVCPLLSVAMVNYNNVGFLESCLQSVMANTTGLRHEIIVVDNHSSDGSVKLVKQQFPRVRLIANQRNAGYGRAINQAVAVARGEFVLILNEDTILLPGAITKTLGFMRARSDAGIVGCRILNPDRSLQGSCRSFPSVWNYASENFFWDRLFPRSRIFGRPYMSYFSYDEVREVDVVLGAFMMVRRNLIDCIGMMDERFFMYSDETDFCYRAKQNGWKTYFFPDAVIIHFGGASTQNHSTDYFIELHRSHHRFVEKHKPAQLPLVKGILFAGLWIRFLIHLNRLIAAEWKGEGDRSIRSDLHKYGYTLAWYAGARVRPFWG